MTGIENDTRAGYGRLRPGPGQDAYDVALSLTPQGVLIRAAGRNPETWTLQSLSAKEPITDHAIDAILMSGLRPGATLFVGDPKLARTLAHVAPQLSERTQSLRRKRLAILAAAAIGASVLAIWAGGFSPARAIAGLLPDTTRAKLGEAVINDLTGDRRRCDSADGRKALETLSARLSEAAGAGEAFSVTVADWNVVNAFAAPGGKIVLARGLLDKAETADELAGILAHEIGHGLERHPETSIIRSLGISAGINLVLGGGLGSLASAGAALAELSYTREAERAADQHALGILKRASIAAGGLAAFFRRIQAEEASNPIDKALNTIEVLRSHPVTGERIAAVEAATVYAATPAMTPQEWRSLKGICAQAPSHYAPPRSSPVPPASGDAI